MTRTVSNTRTWILPRACTKRDRPAHNRHACGEVCRKALLVVATQRFTTAAAAAVGGQLGEARAALLANVLVRRYYKTERPSNSQALAQLQKEHIIAMGWSLFEPGVRQTGLGFPI